MGITKELKIVRIKRAKDGSWVPLVCQKCKRKVWARIDGYCQTCYCKTIGIKFNGTQYYAD